MANHIQLGIATIDITPEKPIPLAGFAFRTEPYEAVRNPLSLRCFAFHYDHEEVIVLSADLLWWGGDTVKSCRVALRNAYPRRDPQRYVFLATHTHHGPQVSKMHADGLGQPDDAYITQLIHATVHVVGEAVGRTRSVIAYHYIGHSDLPINRRKKTDTGIVMAPNPHGARDTALHLIEFVPCDSYEEGSPPCIAVWACAACHPTSSAENLVDPEFLARGVSRYASKYSPETVGCFVQGCCGDTRPSIIHDGQFYRGTLGHESVQLEERFLRELIATRQGRPTELHPPIGGVLRASVAHLPLAKRFPHAQRDRFKDREDCIGEWARHPWPRDTPSTVPLTLTWFRLSTEFSLLFMDGEIMSEYALFTEELSNQTVWAGGYGNGMTAYIPTDEYAHDGGYESYDAMFYFLRPAPYAVGVEATLKREITHLLTPETAIGEEDQSRMERS